MLPSHASPLVEHAGKSSRGVVEAIVGAGARLCLTVSFKTRKLTSTALIGQWKPIFPRRVSVSPDEGPT